MTDNSITSVEALENQKQALIYAQTLYKEYSEKYGRPITASVVTFGCQMNSRDSEKLIGILKEIGFTVIESEEADFVIYNTCTVRDNANQRVYGHLGNLGAMKKKNPAKRVGLCGCMMQEPSVIEKIKTSYPFVDFIFGTHNIFCFPEILCRVLSGEKHVIELWDDTKQIVEDLPVDRKYAFKSGVNIMFGCNNFCTYCIVPYVRGRERSRKSEDILAEIKRLSADGVKEVMLLGQNVNSYGNGLEGEISFPELLKRVEEIDGIERIRFMTSHPKDLSNDLIQVMKQSEKICKHLHLPLQSGSTKILQAMNRRYTAEQYYELAMKLLDEVPDLSLTTDIIVGFPGETYEDAMMTNEMVKKVGYDNAFTFIYSIRTGTPAAKMEQVPREESQKHFDIILKTVQDTARERAKRFEGRTMKVLVEDVNTQDASLVTGRLSNNLLVHFPGNASMIGSICDVSLTENKGFYYIGNII